MHLDNKDTIKLSELINWVKKELLSEEAKRDDPVPLFVIDEVTVEVNFVLSGEGEGGIDLKIVKAGAKVGEERIQKATVKMKSLISYEELASEFSKKHPEIREKVLDESVKVLLKGTDVRTEDSVPDRQ